MKNKILWILLCIILALRVVAEAITNAIGRFVDSIFFVWALIIGFVAAACTLGYTAHKYALTEAIKAHNPCPKRSWDFTVVDSIGRRYRPVPCPKESRDCSQCGEFIPWSEENVKEGWVDEAWDTPVTIIHDDDGRRKKTYFSVAGNCGYEQCDVYVRLERIY